MCIRAVNVSKVWGQKEINIFIRQEFIKLIKSDSKNIYNVKKKICFTKTICSSKKKVPWKKVLQFPQKC